MGLVLRASSRMCPTHSQCADVTEVTQQLAGLTHSMVTPSLYPRDCIRARVHQLSRALGTHGTFYGFSPGCQLLKLDDFHLHLPLQCQGSHVLNWRHPLQLQSLNQLMPPRPQQDVVANVPHVLQHTRHLPSVPPCPDPCTDPASPSPGCPFPQRNHDLGWSQALSNPHNKIMQTRCFSSLASPAWSV